jgi:hypothetical protein
MKFNLPETISSTQDLMALKNEVRSFATWYAHESVKKNFDAKHVTDQPSLSVSASTVLRDWETQAPLSRRTLDELIDEITKYIDTAEVITITLAAPPTSAIKKTLVAWCRKNISPAALVSFQFSATILGGMVFQTGSHVFDWSFKRQLLNERGKFPEILRHV